MRRVMEVVLPTNRRTNNSVTVQRDRGLRTRLYYFFGHNARTQFVRHGRTRLIRQFAWHPHRIARIIHRERERVGHPNDRSVGGRLFRVRVKHVWRTVSENRDRSHRHVTLPRHRRPHTFGKVGHSVSF